MENKFEKKIEIAMKKFEGKNVKITISGIIESRFYIKNLKYVIEENILVLEDDFDVYLDVDIDDIDNMFLEFTTNGYALLVLKIDDDLQIEIQVKDDNVIPIKEKILRWIVESGIAEEVLCEAWGA